MEKHYKYLVRTPDGHGGMQVVDEGVINYTKETEIKAYVDGVISGHSDPWNGDWFYSNQEKLLTKCQKYMEPENNLQDFTHVVIFQRGVDDLSLSQLTGNPKFRYRCIKRYNHIIKEGTDPYQQTVSFLMDKESDSQAKAYVDQIFELSKFMGWKGNWFYSDQEDGWLKFKTTDNAENEDQISHRDHFFIEESEMFFNYNTGHPPRRMYSV